MAKIWDLQEYGDIHHKISSLILQNKPYWHKRNHQILTNKLRLHVCSLNAIFYKKGHRDNPYCDKCKNEEEDMNHFLFQCKSPLAKAIKEKCDFYNIEEKIETALTSQILLKTIIDLIERKI
jgi:hypothetical protein